MALKNILIKTPNWLGDSVMSIPTVVGIKKLYPDSRLSVWTKPGLMDLWRFIPEVEEVVDSVPKEHSFDLGILLTNSFGSALRMYLSRIPERRGYNINWRRFLLTQPVSFKNSVHQVEYFLGIIDPVRSRTRPDVHRDATSNGVDGKGDSTPRINIPESIKDEAREFLVNHGWDGKGDIIGIHATASYGPAKRWDKFTELIDKLSTWVLIVGSEGAIDPVRSSPDVHRDATSNGVDVRNPRVINVVGKTDIKMLSGLISQCRVFISNDSGPMHLAASIGVPVVAIFGSTDPGRTGPRGNCIVLKKDVACSPCFKRECPTDLECMKAIEVSDVLDAVDKLMSEVRPHSLRIAVVMKDYDEDKGGAERYLVGLVKRLAGIDLIVNRVNGTPPDGVNVKRVKAMRWSSILEPLSFNRAVQPLLKGYDIVYGLTQIYPLKFLRKFYGVNPQDVYPALSTTKSNLEARKGWVYRVGGGLEHCWFDIRYTKLWQRLINYLRPRNLVRFYIENKIFSTCKRFITNSQLVKNQILSRYPISPEDVVVVYNGVDTNRFNPSVRTLYRDKVRKELGIGSEDKVVLFISNNWKRKGLRELIKVIKKDMWLIVVGRGKRFDAGDRIRFVGPTKEPERYYGASDVFVLPTYYDPCANVCLEALSCGLPVVTTRMNGASEFIEEGRNGYIFDSPGDIDIEKAFSLKGGGKIPTIEENAQKTIEVLRHVQSVQSFALNTLKRFEGGRVYKRNKERMVVKAGDLFLKRYFNSKVAYTEWQNIFRLRSIGIKTMNPVTVGMDGKDSFLITESLEPAGGVADRRLIYELAILTKRMHKHNLFHKDFYTGHIFVKQDGLYLIDLQRICRHWLFKTRWRIKDLASLNFSSQVGNIDKIRFLRYYMGKIDKKFIKKIIAKTNRIARHTEKMLARRKGLPHPGC